MLIPLTLLGCLLLMIYLGVLPRCALLTREVMLSMAINGSSLQCKWMHERAVQEAHLF